MFNKEELTLILNYCRENITSIKYDLRVEDNENMREALKHELEVAKNVLTKVSELL